MKQTPDTTRLDQRQFGDIVDRLEQIRDEIRSQYESAVDPQRDDEPLNTTDKIIIRQGYVIQQWLLLAAVLLALILWRVW